jgi:hypothetical protein
MQIIRFRNENILIKKEKDDLIVSSFYSDVRSEVKEEKKNLSELLKKMNKKVRYY